MGCPVLHQLLDILSVSQCPVQQNQRLCHIMHCHQVCQLDKEIFPCRSDVFQHFFPVDLFITCGNDLIQNAETIPDRTVCTVCQQPHCAIGDFDAFLPTDSPHAVCQCLQRHPLEVQTHTSGQNGGRQLLGLRGSQNEHDILRRFLQRLQQGIECSCRKHMHFVDDIDLFLPHRRRILDAFPQFPDAVHAVVGCRIDLDDIHKSPVLYSHTVGTMAARPFVILFKFAVTRCSEAVDRLGQDAGRGGFSRSTGSAKEIGMTDRICSDLIFQDFYDMLLPEDFAENLRPLGTVKCCIHDFSLSCTANKELRKIKRLPLKNFAGVGEG